MGRIRLSSRWRLSGNSLWIEYGMNGGSTVPVFSSLLKSSAFVSQPIWGSSNQLSEPVQQAASGVVQCPRRNSGMRSGKPRPQRPKSQSVGIVPARNLLADIHLRNSLSRSYNRGSPNKALQQNRDDVQRY
jgi:hypothetical protein